MGNHKRTEKLIMSDLPDEYVEVAELVGLELFEQMLEIMEGYQIYFKSKQNLPKFQQRVLEKYRGSHPMLIAEKLGCSVQKVRMMTKYAPEETPYKKSKLAKMEKTDLLKALAEVK